MPRESGSEAREGKNSKARSCQSAQGIGGDGGSASREGDSREISVHRDQGDVEERTHGLWQVSKNVLFLGLQHESSFCTTSFSTPGGVMTE